jgi:hypothetical protein
LIRKDVIVLKGSGDRRSSHANRAEALQRDLRDEVAAGRGEPVAVVERKIRTGSADKRLVAK